METFRRDAWNVWAPIADERLWCDKSLKCRSLWISWWRWRSLALIAKLTGRSSRLLWLRWMRNRTICTTAMFSCRVLDADKYSWYVQKYRNIQISRGWVFCNTFWGVDTYQSAEWSVSKERSSNQRILPAPLRFQDDSLVATDTTAVH